MKKKTNSKQVKISKIEVTAEKMSGRGGLFFFIKYVENIGFFKLFEQCLGSLKGSAKGISCFQFIKQVVAWFIDGTDRSMLGFDRRKNDDAYAALLENEPWHMATSHQIKRMFSRLGFVGQWLFRSILLKLFIWRLYVEKPKVIILFGDTVVFDNDDAQKRQGVKPTYKKKKGFQPLQISWGPYVVDALFRPGNVHCNHGTDLRKAVGRLVKAIRTHYADVPIILLEDSGFLDDKNFRFFEERLGIHYACSGKFYEGIKQYVNEVPVDRFHLYQMSWSFVEFGNRLDAWSNFRRCIFTSQETEDNGQMTFDFARPDKVTYTNIGQNKEYDEKLVQAGGADYLKAEKIIELDHSRGKGELVHRSQKDFVVCEQFPFKGFGMNRAFYYIFLMSHFLYEAFKRDITQDVLPVTSYPSTFRRTIIDFAVKIVSTSHQVILKVTQAIYDALKIPLLWQAISEQKPAFVT